jgi:hypothetical protein
MWIYIDKMRKKKAQMEIMGLAMIIILLALAMLFVVRFVVLRPPEDIKKTFTYETLAQNTLNTMLLTTTECGDRPVLRLLIDCAEGGFIQCPQSTNSCTYSQDVIEEIITHTLEEWNKDYYLTIKIGDDDILLPFGSPCPGESTTSHPCCVLPTGYGQLITTLEICS